MEAIQSHKPIVSAAISISPTIEFKALADEIDIYSQDTLQELQDQRFKIGLDLYICVVKEGEKAFYFDASTFMEHCIRDHGIIDNPLPEILLKILKSMFQHSLIPISSSL